MIDKTPTFSTILQYLSNLTDDELEMLDEDKYVQALVTIYHGK
jgi:hypothetical protein